MPEISVPSPGFGPSFLAEMSPLTYVLISLFVMGAVTVALRWAPFAFIRSLQGSPLVEFLGTTMPVGVMVALVVYAMASSVGLGDAEGDPGGWWAAPLALVLTVVVHLWRKNAALSVIVGTCGYVLLVNLVASAG